MRYEIIYKYHHQHYMVIVIVCYSCSHNCNIYNHDKLITILVTVIRVFTGISVIIVTTVVIVVIIVIIYNT